MTPLWPALWLLAYNYSDILFNTNSGNATKTTAWFILQMTNEFAVFYEKEIPWVFPEKVQKFNENYFLIEVCYIHKSHSSQSMNTTWTHGTRRTYTKLVKTFPFWVTVTNSLSFPWLFAFSLTGKLKTHFQGFPWFPEWLGIWEPWMTLWPLTHLVYLLLPCDWALYKYNNM